MKPQSLQALLIDRELGELPPDTVELLDAWLAEHPESATGIPPLRRTLETTTAAIRRFPELGHPQPNAAAFLTPHFRLAPLALAASVLILLGGSAWLGFRAGEHSGMALAKSQAEPAPAPAALASAAKREGPWARYAVGSDPAGGLILVRRDRNL